MKLLRLLVPAFGLAALCPVNPAWAALNDSDSGAVPFFHMPRAERSLPGRPMANVTFLGVQTATIMPALTAQLGLADNVGLVVVEVVPDSPASAALRENDILLKLDDQWLIEPRQFSVLVRNHKAGDEVVLTYMREGKRAAASVKLASHTAPKLASDGRAITPGFVQQGGSDGLAPMGVRDLDRMLFLMDQSRGQFGRAGVSIGGPSDDLRRVEIDKGNSELNYSDDQGTLALTLRDGRKTLLAIDSNGKQLFSGAVDSPEQRKALPGQVRERLEKLEKMNGFSFQAQQGPAADAAPHLEAWRVPDGAPAAEPND